MMKDFFKKAIKKGACKSCPYHLGMIQCCKSPCPECMQQEGCIFDGAIGRDFLRENLNKKKKIGRKSYIGWRI